MLHMDIVEVGQYWVVLLFDSQKAQWRDSITNLSDELDEALTKHLEAELERSVGKGLKIICWGSCSWLSAR